MRMLLVTSSLDGGGAERWVYNTFRHASSLHECVVDYYFFEGVDDDVLLDAYNSMFNSISFRRLHVHGRLEPLYLLHDLDCFIEANGPYDVVHINGTKLLYQAITMIVAKHKNVPVRIVHCHSSHMSDLGFLGSCVRGFLRRCVKSSSTIIGACSDRAATAKYGSDIISNAKYRLFKNGIDVARFSYDEEKRAMVRSRFGVLSDQRLILSIGSMTKNKNQVFLVDAFKECQEIDSNSMLVLVGSGDERQAIIDRIVSYGLSDKVVLVEYTDESESFYCAADVFVLPSYDEGLPFVLLEAQSCGLPCIASTGVSSEADITGLVSYHSLAEGPGQWSEAIFSSAVQNRESYSAIVEEKGYSLESSAECFADICRGG